MSEFPICKTDTEKDNSFNEFSFVAVYGTVNFVFSAQDFTWWRFFVYNRTFTEFYPLEHYKISLLLGTEIL